MTRYLLIIFTLFSGICVAQTSHEVSSFYFSTPQPASAPEVKEFDASILGTYRLSTQKHTKLIVRKDSIIASYFVVFPITMEEVNKNPQLSVSDDLLFGIADRGLPFLQSNDTLIVAMNQREVFCTPTDYVIKREKNTYYINEKVGKDRWKTTILEFSSKDAAIYELDHDKAEKEIYKMSKQIEYDDMLKIIIASPNDKEFASLSKSKGYRSEKIAYRKE
jgi:hypothetical protein